MDRVRQPVYVNDIAFDALIDSSEQYSASAPAYPTEDGFSVSDTLVIEPLKLDMTLYVTATPVTWLWQNGGGESRVDSVVEELKRLFYNKEIVTVETAHDVYTDMVIENMTISKTLEQGYAREIPITFSEVNVVSTQTATIPSSYYYSGATGTSTGTASTSKKADDGDAEGSKATILKSIYNSLTGG